MPLALGLFNAGHYHLRVQTSPQISQTLQQMRLPDLEPHCSETGPPTATRRAKHMLMTGTQNWTYFRKRESTDYLPPSLEYIPFAVILLSQSSSQFCCDNKQSLNHRAFNVECLFFLSCCIKVAMGWLQQLYSMRPLAWRSSSSLGHTGFVADEKRVRGLQKSVRHFFSIMSSHTPLAQASHVVQLDNGMRVIICRKVDAVNQ